MPGPRRRSPAQMGPLAGLASVAAARRFELGLTQQEVADLAAVGISSIRALESGQDSQSLAVVTSVLDVLGLSLAISEGTGSTPMPIEGNDP